MLSECKARSDIPNPEVESLLVFIMYLVSDFLVHYITVISAIWVVHMCLGAFCSLGGAFAWSFGKGAAGNSDFDGMQLLSMTDVKYVYELSICQQK